MTLVHLILSSCAKLKMNLYILKLCTNVFIQLIDSFWNFASIEFKKKIIPEYHIFQKKKNQLRIDSLLENV